jgi:hypothetical protein
MCDCVLEEERALVIFNIYYIILSIPFSEHVGNGSKVDYRKRQIHQILHLSKTRKEIRG